MGISVGRGALRAIGGEMKTPAVISLCDRTGNMVRDWAEAGYTCYCVDVQHSIRRPRWETIGQGGIWFVWGDARSWCPPEDADVHAVFAFSPCTNVAVSGARDFEAKGEMLLVDSLVLFNACRQAARWSGARWALENPVGVLSSVPHIGKPSHYFDPCDYAGYLPENEQQAEAYTKKTCLWTGGGFVMPEAKPVDPVLGSMMHKIPPGPDRADLRAVTPRGFARAVFEANCQIGAVSE